MEYGKNPLCSYLNNLFTEESIRIMIEKTKDNKINHIIHSRLVLYFNNRQLRKGNGEK